MDCYDFIVTLERIALDSGLRLIMNLAPIGCGIIFYFIDDLTNTHSKHVLWMNGKEDPESLFTKLQLLAEEFNTTVRKEGVAK